MPMPELPDITLYCEALEHRLVDQTLRELQISSPFLLRSVEPSPQALATHTVTGTRRLGKRIAIGFANDHWMVLHLMIAGRLHWYPSGRKVPTRQPLMRLVFDHGTLTLTEAGSKKRASLHLADSAESMARHDPGGLEVLDHDADAFVTALTRRNHTLKRALTSPAILSGIGNAYSDEILHHARLSPARLTQSMTADELEQLYRSVTEVLNHWTRHLREFYGGKFPEKVTAFREGMAVHGRYREACPRCTTSIQRIRYAGNETNYCPRCQTGGKLLADRSLSRLLKKDWPKTIEALEQQQAQQQAERNNKI